MKVLILLAIIAFTGWQIYAKKITPVITNADLALLNASNDDFEEPYPVLTSRYTCDGRQHCSEMSSCEEATFFIEHCPDTKMDGDHDGIPCERQFCN